jgi:outer membrane protein assembly factor BamA
LSHFKQDAINREKINKNKEESEVYPNDEPTLYEMYREWGIIPDDVADGGTNSTVRLGLLYDTRDKEGAPSKGIWAEAHATIAPKWLGTTNPYYKFSATWRHYVPIVENDILTFAYRLNYQGTFGKNAPYYVLPYITTMGQSYDRDGMGGFRTIRGIMRNRVQGLDMASYNAELRWRFVSFTLGNQNIQLGLNCFSDGTMVTKEYDMSFGKTQSDFKSLEAYNKAKAGYDSYMGMGLAKDRPHVTAGGGFRFIMNQNFIVCLEYGKPVGKYSKQDGNGAFYINTGYLF